MCGNFQVGNYIQPLWEEIQPVHEGGADERWNGAVEAGSTLAGAGLALLPGWLHLDWPALAELGLALISLAEAGLLYMMATTNQLWPAYLGYTVFRASYQLAITVASFEVARRVRERSAGLVFGFNTFLALSLQTVLTSLVASSAGLALPPRSQFKVYAAFFLAVGIIFLLSGAITAVRHPQH